MTGRGGVAGDRKLRHHLHLERPTRQSASSPTSGDELENIIGTQVDEVQYVDSHGTTVEGDDDSQQQPSPGSSSGSESAKDKTRFRSH